MNTLCDTAMMSAFNDDRDHVTREDIAAAVAELQWVEFAARATSVAAKQAAQHARSAIVRRACSSKVVLSSEGKTLGELHLVPGRKVIGRTPDNDLQIDSKFISRHHCQIITGSDGVSVIEDLNSTNGIVIRGKRVRRHTLRDGDVISLGQHEMLYVDETSSHHLADTHDDLPRARRGRGQRRRRRRRRRRCAGATRRARAEILGYLIARSGADSRFLINGLRPSRRRQLTGNAAKQSARSPSRIPSAGAGECPSNRARTLRPCEIRPGGTGPRAR